MHASARRIAVASLVCGAIFAAAPAFSGLALVTVLTVGAAVAFAVFAAPTCRVGSAVRPAAAMLRRWLLWAVAVTALEAFVLFARDDLRWPTFSALQDPVTTAQPVGRFVAGAAWTASGLGLTVLMRRYRGPFRPWRGIVVAGALALLAVSTIQVGAMLVPRDAPAWQAAGVDNTAVAHWPATAWVSLALFTSLAVWALRLHRAGRAYVPPGTVPDTLAWLMATWPGRIVGYAGWLWCGWHFLSR